MRSNPRLPSALVLAALFGGFAGCSADPIACIGNADCPSGQYCRATVCVEPSADGPLEDVYRARIAPLIETGCNCHGPTTERLWRYDHSDDPERFARSLAELRNWLYDPSVAAGAIPERPALLGYAAAQCGFRHPLIWETQDGQYLELLAWARRAHGELQRPRASIERPSPDPTMTLPPREQAELDAAKTASQASGGWDPFLGFEDGPDRHLTDRVVRQCGCCHTDPRPFKVEPPLLCADGEPPIIDGAPAEVGSGDILCSSAVWLPGQLNYGLGIGQHPVVYSSADDPRYALLFEWFTFALDTPDGQTPLGQRATCNRLDACEPDMDVPMPPPGDGGLDAMVAPSEWDAAVGLFRDDWAGITNSCNGPCHQGGGVAPRLHPDDADLSDAAIQTLLMGLADHRARNFAPDADYDGRPMFDRANPAAGRFMAVLNHSPQHPGDRFADPAAVERLIRSLPPAAEVVP